MCSLLSGAIRSVLGIRDEMIHARAFLCFSLVAILWVEVCWASRPGPAGRNDTAGLATVRLEPHYEVRQGVEVIWQIPPNVRRILFIAHGVGFFPNNFWDPSPACPVCTGLPEERAITLAALSRGYAVISVSSLGETWMDWPLRTNRDFYNVLNILSTWIDQFRLAGLPITGLGISDGGTFLSILALEVDEFESIVLMISSANDDAIDFAAQEGDYPPTLFIQMPNDESSRMSIAENMRKMSEAGIVTADIKCYSFPVYDSYFTERIPGLDLDTSIRIVESLRAHNYLDSKGYIVRPNPAGTDWDVYEDWDWVEVVHKLGVLPVEGNGTVKWEQAVREELSLAYAFHCPTSLRSTEMLDWLDGTIWPKKPNSLVAAI